MKFSAALATLGIFGVTASISARVGLFPTDIFSIKDFISGFNFTIAPNPSQILSKAKSPLRGLIFG
jgi:hypothetical protein